MTKVKVAIFWLIEKWAPACSWFLSDFLVSGLFISCSDFSLAPKYFKWCDDYRSRYYNKLIRSNKKDKFSFENLYRTDFKYNYIILIEYNYPKPVKKKGSAIFIHLTKTYKPTTGCVTLRKKDFIILCKLITNKTKIKII